MTLEYWLTEAYNLPLNVLGFRAKVVKSFENSEILDRPFLIFTFYIVYISKHLASCHIKLRILILDCKQMHLQLYVKSVPLL